MGDQAAFERWLKGFQNAFESNDAERLRPLFASQAVMYASPFDAPVDGGDNIVQFFANKWSRLNRTSIEFQPITSGWARVLEGGSIEALDEPTRSDSVFRADLNDAGVCISLTFWTERMSVREADMLAQRDS